MKKEEAIQEKTCPICGATYTAAPALSRVDNQTPICPDCGTRQALASIGVGPEEQEKILGMIKNFSRKS